MELFIAQPGLKIGAELARECSEPGQGAILCYSPRLLPRADVFLDRAKCLVLADHGDAGTVKHWVIFYHPTYFSILQPRGSCLTTYSPNEINRNIDSLFAFK